MKHHLILIFGLLIFSALTSCEKNKDGCGTLKSLGKNIKINNEEFMLSVENIEVTSFLDGEITLYEIVGFTSDCSEIISFDLTTNNYKGELEGLFTVVPFTLPKGREISGLYTHKAESPEITQKLESGVATIKKIANTTYSINLTAKTEFGDSISLEGNFLIKFL